jgi:hypothetical protein
MDLKYKLERTRLRVRVKRQPGPYGQNYLTDEDVGKIDQYVEQRNLGRRIAYDIWRFNDKAALTMFMLRWQ